MDAQKQLAITACGRCGLSEEAHKGRAEDSESFAVLGALGGACTAYVASDASLMYAQHLGIADGRAPQRTPGRIGKRRPLCSRCGHRGHRKETCPL